MQMTERHFYLSGFSFMDTDDLARRTAGEGRRSSLFFSNSTHSQTFRQRSILQELVYDTPYASADNIHKLISYIEAASKRLFKCLMKIVTNQILMNIIF